MPAHPGGSWWAAFGEQCWQWQGWRGSFWWGKFLLWWLCDLGTRQNRNVVQVLSLYSLSTTESGDQHVMSLEAHSSITKLLFSLGSAPDACHEHGKLWVFHKYTLTIPIIIISYYHHHYHQSLSPPLSSVIITTTITTNIISHYHHHSSVTIIITVISHYQHHYHLSLFQFSSRAYQSAQESPYSTPSLRSCIITFAKEKLFQVTFSSEYVPKPYCKSFQPPAWPW